MKLFLPVLALIFSLTVNADPMQLRKNQILQLFKNQSPELIMDGGLGRLSLEPRPEKTFFVFCADPSDPSVPTILLPLATSRFDRYNYSTPAWWSAHKADIAAAKIAGLPIPKQNPDEVVQWLAANGLSTNPDVTFLWMNGTVTKKTLQEYLLSIYVHRAHGGLIDLYRGARTSDEPKRWQQGEVPRGVRYWTPDPTYAWRYARKSGTAVLRFSLPWDKFVSMVKSKGLILGAELPRSVHQNLESGLGFTDNLYSGAYLGNPELGVEFEIRATKSALSEFTTAYRSQLSEAEMKQYSREQVILGFDRLIQQNPARKERLVIQKSSRLKLMQLASDSCSEVVGVQHD